jgi:tRNA(Ile)-lysidine synthase
MDRFAAAGGWPGALAVSGGGDSLALMHLAAGWAKARRLPPPIVLSVDHGLTEGSDRIARWVARQARGLGLKAVILTASGKKPKSDIEAWARETRYGLMGAWLAKHRIGTLYLGHTENDQAETFLLRLARGSGLDGLSAMRPLAAFPVSDFSGHRLARPLLGHSRAALRDWLEGAGVAWRDDPMNRDLRFVRTRIRALSSALDEAGLSARRIADAARHLARAREALDLVTEAVLARAAAPHAEREGALLVDAAALIAAPREVALRALALLLSRVSGKAYRPRFESLERLLDAVTEGTLGGGATLSGCRLSPAPRRWQAFGPQTLVLQRESSQNRA